MKSIVFCPWVIRASNEVYITQLHPSTINKIPELQLDCQMDSNAERQNHASSSPNPGPGAFRRATDK